MITEHTFKLTVVTDFATGTTVAILMDSFGREIGSGAAKLHPSDTFNPRVGSDIAQYRAVMEFFGDNVIPSLR